MHELGITESLVKIATDTAAEHQAAKVLRMNIAMGELSSYETICIQEYFQMLSEGTPAENCELVFRLVKPRCHCKHCNIDFEPKHYSLACPQCGTYKTEVLEGRELFVENIEIETKED